MLGQVFRCPSVLERIRANPLGNWLRDYSAYLDERGHPRTSSRNMLELSSISAPGRLGTPGSRGSHTGNHPCVFPRPSARVPLCWSGTDRAVARRGRSGPAGAAPRSAGAANPGRLAPESGRGGPRTLPQAPAGRARVSQVRAPIDSNTPGEFLCGKFGDGPANWAALRPEDPMAFVAGYAARCHAGTVQLVATSLRGLLRYLQFLRRCLRRWWPQSLASPLVAGSSTADDIRRLVSPIPGRLCPIDSD